MRKRYFRFMLLLVVSCLSFSAFSANMNFLENSAMQYFNDKDWALLNAAIDKALDTTPNGKKLEWKNPNNSHGGYVQPLNTTENNGMKCRQLKMVSTDGSQVNPYQFNYCKINGVWKIAGN